MASAVVRNAGRTRQGRTDLADRTGEINALRRVIVRVVRSGEVVGCDAFLDPAHDRVEDIVLRVVREGGVCISGPAEGVRARAALLKVMSE